MRLVPLTLAASPWLGLALLALGACSDDASSPPPATTTPGVEGQASLDLDVPPSCDDIGADQGWRDVVCETGQSGACHGQGVATFDCDACCEAPPPPSCTEVAARQGWTRFTCETEDNQACNGLGEASSDCGVCCEAIGASPGEASTGAPTEAPPPTCVEVAAHWGYEQIGCETAADPACGGEGPATSDCAHCCDTAPTELALDDPQEDLSEDSFLLTDEPLPDGTIDDGSLGDGEIGESTTDDASTPPPPPPPPGTCADLAAGQGWPNPRCENHSNGACNGQGPATKDCDHCCAGKATPNKCGDGVCDSNESARSCAQDCKKRLRVGELHLDGASDPKLLHRASRALADRKKKRRPAVLGVQGATRAQVEYLARQVKVPSLRFAVSHHDGQRKLGNAVLSSYQTLHVKAQRLPGKTRVLELAEVRGPGRSFLMGSTQFRGDAAAAATKTRGRLNEGHAMLAAALGDTSSSRAYRLLDQKLPDGWKSAWGAGHTTPDRREDFVFHGPSWAATSGTVAGPQSGVHRSLVESYTLDFGSDAPGAECQFNAYNCKLPNYESAPKALKSDRNRKLNDRDQSYLWCVQPGTPLKDGHGGVRGEVVSEYSKSVNAACPDKSLPPDTPAAKINFGQRKAIGGQPHVYAFSVVLAGQSDRFSGWIPEASVLRHDAIVQMPTSLPDVPASTASDGIDWVVTGGDVDAAGTLLLNATYGELKVNPGVSILVNEKASDYLVRQWNATSRTGYVNFLYAVPGVGGVTTDTLPMCVHFKRYQHVKPITIELYKPREQGSARVSLTETFVYGVIDGRRGWMTREMLTDAKKLSSLHAGHPCRK